MPVMESKEIKDYTNVPEFVLPNLILRNSIVWLVSPFSMSHTDKKGLWKYGERINSRLFMVDSYTLKMCQ